MVTVENRTDQTANVVVAFELPPGWFVVSPGAQSDLAKSIAVTAPGRTKYDYQFRLTTTRPRQDYELNVRLSVQADGQLIEAPSPIQFNVTSFGEGLCH